LTELKDYVKGLTLMVTASTLAIAMKPSGSTNRAGPINEI